jgi:hypothetical protein
MAALTSEMRSVTLVLLVVGVIFGTLPSGVVLFSDRPDWFVKATFTTSAYIVISIAAFSIVYSVVLHFWENTYTKVFFAITALPFVVVPNLYSNGAYFLGYEKAEFSTWHLLSLFAAMYQAASTTIVAVVTLVAIFVVWLFSGQSAEKS